VLEGDEEFALTGRQSLELRLGDIVLHLRPGSFFQTNTAIASGLYAQAREWIDAAAANSVWDLYCGVGGFALHVAAPGRQVHGVELSATAVEAARLSAAEAELPNVTFEVGDELCAMLDASGVPTLIYSSCNAVTLARDLAAMPAYFLQQARVFDMFPQTGHYEVMALLDRR
jgi:23S rRNA (uracil747-C5)-methyltransferase